MRPLLGFLGALPFVFVVAASCSASDSGGTPGAGGGSGTGGTGFDSSVCGFCTGKTFTPCVDGQPGDTQACDAYCLDGMGCVECLPGSTVCVGNDVHACGDDGKIGALKEGCNVAGGQLCNLGKCDTACDVVASMPSNLGCEFWAVDLDQVDAMNDPASAPWGVVLSNAGQGTAKVTIEINEAPFGQPVQTKLVKETTIPASGLEQIILPTREVDCGPKPNDYTAPGTCLSSNAYRIKSDSPIIVYQFNVFENAYSNDASLLLPTTALGKVHRIINWGAGHPILITIPGLPTIIDRSYVTVVGVKPNTTVKVRPSWRIKGNPPIPAAKPGETIEATIGPFDVLNLETDDATMADPAETMADLTGTVVESNEPVVVFSGVESTAAPGWVDIPTYSGWTEGDSCCLDHLEEQMFPVESVGRKYVISRSPVRSTSSYKEPDVIRFLGVAETANVKTSLPAPYDSFTLQPGDVKTTWAQGNFTVDSDKPVMVGQFLISQQYVDGPYMGDPSMTVFPPVDQFRTEYVILTPTSWIKNYVVIANPVGAKVVLDGSSTDSCKIEPAGTLDGVTWESRTCPLTAGVHKLTGDKPYGIVAYGYGSAGSYAFVGGADVKHIYDPPPIK